eukprot:252208-Prorocentrum_minimum.AAC.1
MAAGFPRNPSCPSGRPDHPPVRGRDLEWLQVLTPPPPGSPVGLRTAIKPLVKAILPLKSSILPPAGPRVDPAEEGGGRHRGGDEDAPAGGAERCRGRAPASPGGA